MIRDIIFYTVMVFGIGLAILLSYIGATQLNVAFNGTTDADVNTRMNTFTTRFPNVMDGTFFTILIAAFVGLLVLVWVIETNPAVFFALLIIITLVAVFAGYLANSWYEFTQETVFSAAVTEFPIMDWVLSNYLVVITLFSIMALIVFLAKPNRGGL